MKTKVKVKRTELVRIVEGRVKKLERDHERAAERARQGKPFGDRYGRVSVPDMPSKPNGASGELCNLRRVLATLKIGAEDSILLSQEDANVYFGPCRT